MVPAHDREDDAEAGSYHMTSHQDIRALGALGVAMMMELEPGNSIVTKRTSLKSRIHKSIQERWTKDEDIRVHQKASIVVTKGCLGVQEKTASRQEVQAAKDFQEMTTDMARLSEKAPIRLTIH